LIIAGLGNKFMPLKNIIVFLVIILILHVAALINGLYWLIPWLDIPMHILGGVWVAMFFGYLNQKFFKSPSFWPSVLLTLSFVALFGVLWEFFEFFLNHTSSLQKFGSFQGDLTDTMADLFFGLIGGLIFILLDKVFKKNKIKT